MTLFDKYLKKRLGLASAKDCLEGNIELTDLSSVASKIYFDIFSASDFGGGEFHAVIEKATDIDYAVKRANEGDDSAKKEIEDLRVSLQNLVK
ncbi:hypothetical protein C4564_00475 [Candidatus Microgenomates bacterium]|nr:MAG: hypothetical protein C4564_00475 [Candidatus Microgenomates bacterium]